LKMVIQKKAPFRIESRYRPIRYFHCYAPSDDDRKTGP
jgi:hypothetical protein